MEKHNGEIMPGPPPNLPDGDCYSRLSNGYELSQKYKNEYGPIDRIWDGKNAELGLTQPEDVLAFYQNGGMHIKPRHLNIGEFFHRIMGDSIGLKNQDEWRSMKKLTNPFFNEKASMSFLPEIIRDTKIWLQNLPKEPKTKVINNVSEFTFPLIESIKYLTFFWISKLLYGRLISTENINQLVTMGELHESIMEICFSQRLPRFWFYKWFPTTNNQRLIQFLKQWKNFNIRMMQLTDEEFKKLILNNLHY
ncbi:hypothetical protein F8M41_021408 [Gigaspora margarita]|uniref:Cytochrome P450 n=1 Tax=Gigaspora margarita TaxID=4874 RepID=A0A8H4EJ29_GIGMA|nr:hypothetical protein F8M41_021408 [Gigaspora margarita]